MDVIMYPIKRQSTIFCLLLVSIIQDYKESFLMFLTKATITSVSKINTITSIILFNNMLKEDKVEIIGIVLTFKSSECGKISDIYVLFSGHNFSTTNLLLRIVFRE